MVLTVLLASPRSFCAEVQRTLAVVEQIPGGARWPPLYAQADGAQHPRVRRCRSPGGGVCRGVRFPDRQTLAAAGSDTCAATFAVLPRFVPHATRDQSCPAHGLDRIGIATAVGKCLASTTKTSPLSGPQLRLREFS